MKKPLAVGIGIVLMVGSTFCASPSGAAEAQGKRRGESLFRSKQMVGVTGAFLGSAQPPMLLGGVPGGGLPWVLTRGEANLDDSGELRVRVEGVVLDPNDPTVKSQGLAGINPVPRFFATLSCRDADTGDVKSSDTQTVEATKEGDAKIKAQLDLSKLPPPGKCLDPIILVRGDLSSVPGNPFNNPEGPDPTDPWFVASGF
jgi:hypothetical protein